MLLGGALVRRLAMRYRTVFRLRLRCGQQQKRGGQSTKGVTGFHDCSSSSIGVRAARMAGNSAASAATAKAPKTR